MILIDTNLLLYAIIEDYPQHKRTRHWLDEQFAGSGRVGLPWHSLLGCIRLASNRKIYAGGPSADEVWQVVRKWLALDNVWVPLPTERHAELIDGFFSTSNVRSDDVMDIHLAALAIEHGLTLCSADNGFSRYRNLRWLNPLES